MVKTVGETGIIIPKQQEQARGNNKRRKATGSDIVYAEICTEGYNRMYG